MDYLEVIASARKSVERSRELCARIAESIEAARAVRTHIFALRMEIARAVRKPRQAGVAEEMEAGIRRAPPALKRSAS